MGRRRSPIREQVTAVQRLGKIKAGQRRLIQARLILTDPDGQEADHEAATRIVANAIGVAERLGCSVEDFASASRAQVFRNWERRRKRAASQEAHNDLDTVQLEDGDAAVVLRGEGSYAIEVFDPDGNPPGEATEQAFLAYVLAHFASDPDLLGELAERYGKYLLENEHLEH